MVRIVEERDFLFCVCGFVFLVLNEPLGKSMNLYGPVEGRVAMDDIITASVSTGSPPMNDLGDGDIFSRCLERIVI